MPDSKPPLIGRLWSLVWLIIVATVAVWLAGQLFAAVWGWLLLIAVVAGAGLAIYVWLRSRQDRW